MQPPIPDFTVLQNRYRLLGILGQGGFGRTYLAEDKGRFNEKCALKEFIPNGSSYSVQKSRELFQREAAVLYQIQHPQIPQFRAIFEENGRLFLVQDYVPGKTYRLLLQERKAAGAKLSEMEVVQLIDRLLPVLDYLHSHDIIHRDISPDNIILRSQDGMPVLIDFGVVRELATRLQFPETDSANTTVGKLGYAPSEQIQSGRAYPSSDLYALAVTALVLLTGREPQELFDDEQLTWHWEKLVQPRASAILTKVLNRMLSLRPGARYSTAREVAVALEALARRDLKASQIATVAAGENSGLMGEWEAPSVTVTPGDIYSRLWDNPKAIAALTLGLMIVTSFSSWAIVTRLRSGSVSPAESPPTRAPVVPETPEVGVGQIERPLPPEAVGMPTPIPTPMPTPTLTPTTPKPTAAPRPIPTTPKPIPSARPKPPQARPEPPPSPADMEYITYNQPLKPSLGLTTSVEGTLKTNEIIRYEIWGEAGQELSAAIGGDGTLMTITGPDGKLVDERSQWVEVWDAVLPARGKYIIQINPLYGLAKNNYKLDVLLLPLPPTPRPTPRVPQSNPSNSPPSSYPPSSNSRSTYPTDSYPTDSYPTDSYPTDSYPTDSYPTDSSPPFITSPQPVEVPPAPLVEEEQLYFPYGENVIQVSGRISAKATKRYFINVRKGETFRVESISGAVGLDIRYPNGDMIEDRMVIWEERVPESGNYQIDVVAPYSEDFTIKISVK
ncbi:MAG: serine/threonine protein kinase [Oscillatoria sp. SIO1A7]|nr:serine/threonine protein kinase [Oscillatoria sp. SIO1A7]